MIIVTAKLLRLAGDLFSGLEETGETVNVKKILAPLVPSAILAIGLNYHQHAEETGIKDTGIPGAVYEKSRGGHQSRRPYPFASLMHGAA